MITLDNKRPVVVLGDVMEDVIVRPQGPMVRGSDVRAEIRSMPGGSGANQALWLAHFGVDARFIARVGAADRAHYDAFFKARGVVPILSGDPQLSSGRLVTLVDADGERSFFTDRAANAALSQADIPDEICEQAGLVLLSGYAFFEPSPRNAALHLSAQAKAAEVPVAIDPSSIGFLAEIGRDNFLGWTHGMDMCFPNRDEAELLSGCATPEDQVRALGAHFGLVVIKLGADGAIAGTRDGILAQAPAKKIDAVDSTGAGDVFMAGFVSAMRNGAPLQACLEAGNEAGALATRHMGGQPV